MAKQDKLPSLLDAATLRSAFAASFVKLDPRELVKNPVMFTVEMVALVASVLTVRDIAVGTPGIGFEIQIVAWLWVTVLFATFAEAVAEGRGKAQADTLRRMRSETIAKVLLGSTAILLAAILLGYATVQQSGAHPGRALAGILAAAGASLLWGTMYIPYRKAYISGMNPLSFVTVFTIGELVTMFALVLALDGGTHAQLFHSAEVRPMLFWLFLGGFVWVIGDIFQQYACKYLGIGRGIPLSNTNQLWGMAWGALVFGELAHADMPHRLLVVAGSIVMILGALAVSTAVAGARENASTDHALEAECRRYGLDNQEILAHWSAPQNSAADPAPRRWWDYGILLAALGVFLWLGAQARPPALAMNLPWLAVLSIVGILTALASGYALWRTTRFS